MSAMFTPSSVFCRTEPEMSSSSLSLRLLGRSPSHRSCPRSLRTFSGFGSAPFSDGEEPSDGTVSLGSQRRVRRIVVLTAPVSPAEALTAVPGVCRGGCVDDTPAPWSEAKAVCDLKMFGRLLVALWLAAVAVESLESRAPGTLSPSSLTFSASLDTSGDVVAAEAVDAVTAKVPTSRDRSAARDSGQ
jgi:hypothetical protein